MNKIYAENTIHDVEIYTASKNVKDYRQNMDCFIKRQSQNRDRDKHHESTKHLIGKSGLEEARSELKNDAEKIASYDDSNKVICAIFKVKEEETYAKYAFSKLKDEQTKKSIANLGYHSANCQSAHLPMQLIMFLHTHNTIFEPIPIAAASNTTLRCKKCKIIMSCFCQIHGGKVKDIGELKFGDDEESTSKDQCQKPAMLHNMVTSRVFARKLRQAKERVNERCGQGMKNARSKDGMERFSQERDQMEALMKEIMSTDNVINEGDNGDKYSDRSYFTKI